MNGILHDEHFTQMFAESLDLLSIQLTNMLQYKHYIMM